MDGSSYKCAQREVQIDLLGDAVVVVDPLVAIVVASSACAGAAARGGVVARRPRVLTILVDWLEIVRPLLLLQMPLDDVCDIVAVHYVPMYERFAVQTM